MKSNRVIWIVVIASVWITVAIVLDAPKGHGQEKRTVHTEVTPKVTNQIFSKYGVVDYDGVESLEASELERRKRASERYDNEGWVMKNPHPDDVKVGRISETVPPPLIPAQESDLVVTAKVIGVSTRLSNDKTGIYTEFAIKVNESIKNSPSVDLKAGITIDRAGGVVRYPNGQMVLYEDKGKGLPETGKEYILFLKGDQKSGNYQIITLYELNETTTIPLDSGRNFDEIKRTGKAGFLQNVREELGRSVHGSSARKP